LLLDPVLQMWFVFALIGVTLTLYALEQLPLEITSLAAISALMLFFHFFPVADSGGYNLLSPQRFLSGFANPALIAVLATQVTGERTERTGTLDKPAQMVRRIGRQLVAMSVSLLLVVSKWDVRDNQLVEYNSRHIYRLMVARCRCLMSRVMMPLRYQTYDGDL